MKGHPKFQSTVPRLVPHVGDTCVIDVRVMFFCGLEVMGFRGMTHVPADLFTAGTCFRIRRL